MNADDTNRPELTTEQVMLIHQAAERLRHHFSGTFNAETIERYVQSIETVREICDEVIRGGAESLIASLDLRAATTDGRA